MTSELRVHPSNLVSIWDSMEKSKSSPPAGEVKSSGELFLEQVNSLDLEAEQTSLNRRSTLWSIALCASAIAFVALAVLTSTHALIAFSVTSFLLAFVTMIAGLPLSTRVVTSCYEKAKDCGLQAEYTSSIAKQVSNLSSMESTVFAQLCSDLDISQENFANSKTALKILIAEFQSKEKEILRLLKNLEASEEEFSKATTAPLENGNAPLQKRVADLVDSKNRFSEIEALKRTISTKKVEAAALLAYLQDPKKSLPQMHLLPLSELTREAARRKEEPHADAFVVIEPVIQLSPGAKQAAITPQFLELEETFSETLSELADRLNNMRFQEDSSEEA